MAPLGGINWSAKEDEILINFVRLHEILYDVKHPQYRKAELRKDLWRELGEILNKTGSACYKRWCCVRDYYIRRRGKQTGGGEELKRRFKLLSFLDNYTILTRRTTNYSEKEDTQDNNELYMIHVTEDVEDPLSDKGDSNNDTYKSNNSEEDNVEDCEVSGSIKKTLIWNPRHSQGHEIKLETATDNDRYNIEEETGDIEEETKDIKVLKRKHRQAQKTLNQILQNTVYKVQKNPNENEWDETDLFFSSIAKIVKKLPRREQIELRMKIGSLVGSAELNCIGYNSPHRGSPQPSTSGNDFPEITTALKKSRNHKLDF